LLFDSPGCKNNKVAGNSVKTNKKATDMPMVIIQPKSMIGRMPLNNSEANATIVVIAV